MRWCGNIGFGGTVEISPSVWEERIVANRFYTGFLIRDIRNRQGTQTLNDNVTISNKIKIIADPFASDNIMNMKYAEFMGVKWKIDSVEVQYPELVLTLGGVYNVT